MIHFFQSHAETSTSGLWTTRIMPGIAASIPLTTNTYHGFQQHSWHQNATHVYCDNNNGDTAFVLVGEAMIDQMVVPTSKATINPSATPDGLCILSGPVGWFRGTDENAYYSNNTFRNVTEEVLLDESGEEITIVNMFKAGDGVTVFAITKDANGTVKLFRY
jgi:hypothetical protein